MFRVASTAAAAEYWVYVSDRGNVFMTEIASLIAAGLADVGHSVIFPAPGLPEPGRNRINVVVAPHEFFFLYTGATSDEIAQSASHSICIGVEQPGTEWFERGLSYACEGPLIFDISALAIDELTHRGYDAERLTIGYHPTWDRWGGDRDRKRHVDVLFLGALTERRDAVLGNAARYLWEWQSDFRLFSMTGPIRNPRSHFLTGRDKWDRLADSRVLLNVHRGEVPYFEWIRALEAVMNGCLVVTETSIDYGPLVPGEHIVAVPGALLGPYATSILTDEDRRSAMAEAAYDLIRTKFEMASLLRPACELMEEVSARHRRRRPIETPLPLISAWEQEPPSPAPHPLSIDALETERQIGVRVKQLLDHETTLIRQVERLQACITHGNGNHADIVTTSSWDAATPDVSVIISSYNYSSVVTRAIDSAVASTGVSAEIIVIDDHSADDSVDVIRESMSHLDWFPIKLVARAANAGLSAARNLGADHARSDKLFMLDADNRIFPRGLQLLSAELDRSPEAAFTYGIIVKQGDDGLLSATPWDVALLARGNYIDAMAMLRRSAFDSAGRYDANHGIWGWEDYELWLRMANLGYKGVLVPTLIGSYEVHQGSMLETVNLDSSNIYNDLRERYPSLPWPLD